MKHKTDSINNVLEVIKSLDVDNQIYISEVLSRRLVELRREKIVKRLQEAEQAYNEGRIKRGCVEDLWKDLND